MVDRRSRRTLLREGAALTVAAAGGALLADGATAAGRPSPAALRELARRTRGPVVTPGSSRYAAARRIAQGAYAPRPAAVVQARDAADVAATLRWGAERDVRVVPRSGGHGFAGWAGGDPASVVVDLGRLRHVGIADGQAVVGPGAQLIDVYAGLARRGLTLPAGTCPSVGFGGLALGGGIGPAVRGLGLTSDRLRSARVATATGELRTVDRRGDEELLWALRGGGGGQFAVLLEARLEPAAVRRSAWFAISWPWSAAEQALAAWQALVPDADPRLSSTFSLLRGTTPAVRAIGQWLGDDVGALRRAIAPLTRIGGARLSSGVAPHLTNQLRWAGCLGQPLAACHTAGTRPGGRMPRETWAGTSDYLARPLDAAGRRRLTARLEARRGGSGAIILDALGGAVRDAADPGAFPHRAAIAQIQHYAQPGSGGLAGARAWVRGNRRALRGRTTGGAYVNYPDPGLGGFRRAYYGASLERLRAVRRRVDPDRRLRFPQDVG
ncbi:FAD-dependent oxidoreductase [Patulibacter defluvii]|uniref:FAD-dependent oxidoreductase n=1 Tax=Patulibacter defluvii TaxID=3095358 RepID=UPI002A7538E8|nr:FAD-binding protein [Patulibacter sp. DM4]